MAEGGSLLDAPAIMSQLDAEVDAIIARARASAAALRSEVPSAYSSPVGVAPQLPWAPALPLQQQQQHHPTSSSAGGGYAGLGGGSGAGSTSFGGFTAAHAAQAAGASAWGRPGYDDGEEEDGEEEEGNGESGGEAGSDDDDDDVDAWHLPHSSVVAQPSGAPRGGFASPPPAQSSYAVSAGAGAGAGAGIGFGSASGSLGAQYLLPSPLTAPSTLPSLPRAPSASSRGGGSAGGESARARRPLSAQDGDEEGEQFWSSVEAFLSRPAPSYVFAGDGAIALSAARPEQHVVLARSACWSLSPWHTAACGLSFVLSCWGTFSCPAISPTPLPLNACPCSFHPRMHATRAHQSQSLDHAVLASR
jgi:hypothetical protein